MMLTMGGVSCSGPGLETICLGIEGTVETGRGIGGGSEYASTGGWSTPLAGSILSGKILKSMHIRRLKYCGKDSLLPGFCICRCYRLMVIRSFTWVDQRRYRRTRRTKKRRYFPFERLRKFIYAIALWWSFLRHDSQDKRCEVAVTVRRSRC